jgi:hypothetical protein
MENRTPQNSTGAGAARKRLKTPRKREKIETPSLKKLFFTQHNNNKPNSIEASITQSGVGIEMKSRSRWGLTFLHVLLRHRGNLKHQTMTDPW